MRYLIAFILFAVPALAETFPSSRGDLKVTQVVEGLEHPWAFAFLPGGALLITERPGRLKLFKDGTLSAPIPGLPDLVITRQGGLLDVALARDFSASGEIYLSYSARAPGGGQTQVARARLAMGDAPRLMDTTIIFRQEPAQQTGHHFGSRIVVAEDGSLFLTVGDRGQRSEAQNTDAHQGSVLRILRDGAPHPDNPFLNGGGQPAIWSYGHRNPQGATLGADGQLWTVEHGAMGGDEINRPKAGRNYGWPVISYGQHYSGAKIGVGTRKEGMEQPEYYWDPSIAPSGLAEVHGPMFADWQGDLMVGGLKLQALVRLDVEKGKIVDEERLFLREFGRIRDVRIGPDGAIWFATDARNGGIYRVAPAE